VTVTADTIPIPRLAPSAPPALRPSTAGERVALACLLLATAALYGWGLGSAGWTDPYHAAAVQAMAQDRTAFLFGSTDAGGTVTVDRPPAGLWPMALSARVFGFSTWSVLVPQALVGVAAVAVLHATVRRVAGPVGGLVAGAVLALMPVTAGTFRATDPDALLVLLLVAAAYAVVRATRTAGTGWLLLAGGFVGIAALTHTAAALVPLPAMALAHLVAAPTGLRRRVRQLVAAGFALVVAGGWWFALVELTPAGSRPYVGGSRTDSALERVLTGAGEPAGPGLAGMVDAAHGPFVGWLLPPALALFLVGLWLGRGEKRTDPTRASLLLWGGWTVSAALAIGLAGAGVGDAVVLAPGVAALAGVGGALLWERRRGPAGRAAGALLVAATAAWMWVVLDRAGELPPWWRWAVLAVAALAVAGLLVRPRRVTGTLLGLVLAATVLTGPAALAAPAVAEGGPGAAPGAIGAGEDGPAPPDAALVELLRSTSRKWSASTVGAEDAAVLALASGTSVLGIGGRDGLDPAPTLEEFQDHVAEREVRWFVDGGPPDRVPEIAAWVRENFAPISVGGRTVYDLDPESP